MPVHSRHGAYGRTPQRCPGCSGRTYLARWPGCLGPMHSPGAVARGIRTTFTLPARWARISFTQPARWPGPGRDTLEPRQVFEKRQVLGDRPPRPPPSGHANRPPAPPVDLASSGECVGPKTRATVQGACMGPKHPGHRARCVHGARTPRATVQGACMGPEHPRAPSRPWASAVQPTWPRLSNPTPTRRYLFPTRRCAVRGRRWLP
jgi:hypothetical protein